MPRRTFQSFCEEVGVNPSEAREVMRRVKAYCDQEPAGNECEIEGFGVFHGTQQQRGITWDGPEPCKLEERVVTAMRMPRRRRIDRISRTVMRGVEIQFQGWQDGGPAQTIEVRDGVVTPGHGHQTPNGVDREFVVFNDPPRRDFFILRYNYDTPTGHAQSEARIQRNGGGWFFEDPADVEFQRMDLIDTGYETWFEMGRPPWPQFTGGKNGQDKTPMEKAFIKAVFHSITGYGILF